MWEWPLPLLQSPPWDVTLRIQRALLCSCSTWWCRARVFADHVDLQPQYGSAVAALTRAAALPCTPQLLACVKVHAAQLGLEVQEPVRSSYILRAPHGDRRVRQLLSSGFPPRWGGVVDGGTPAGQHALRLIARNKCLSHVNLSRQDAEGLLDADLTLSSERVWRDWVSTLSRDHCLFLHIFRGGAVSSPRAGKAFLALTRLVRSVVCLGPLLGTGGSRDNRVALLNPGGSSSELAPIGGAALACRPLFRLALVGPLLGLMGLCAPSAIRVGGPGDAAIRTVLTRLLKTNSESSSPAAPPPAPVEGPGVVLVLSSSEFNDVQLALSSTGGKSPMTLVFLDSPDADTHVFVESGRATAPDLRPAKLIALGPLIEAPHRIEPRAAAQFDHSPNVLGGATDVVVCRLTLVKEYCSLLRSSVLTARLPIRRRRLRVHLLRRALAYLEGSSLSDADLAPAGVLQAHLRVLAAKDLQKHPADYEYLQGDVSNEATRIATAGEWADSVSLQALAHATGVELRVWAFDAKRKRWQLHVVMPRCAQGKRPKPSKVLWLVLEI
ncbi:unnamed protein product [Symbiodinium sp. KB8]|nr:unnamed protein product [Symbiodinium sp. KB8]